jgi:hypothetical protein
VLINGFHLNSAGGVACGTGWRFSSPEEIDHFISLIDAKTIRAL